MIKEIHEPLEQYIEHNRDEIINNSGKVVYLSFKDLIEFDVKLAEHFVDNHEEFVKFFQIMMKDKLDIEKNVRFMNVYDTYQMDLWKVRAEHINQFVKIKGQISVISTISPKVTNMKFECQNCGNVINVLQRTDVLKVPSRCSCGKKQGFRELSREYQDYMKIIVEEDQTKVPIGQQPGKMIVELYDDLTRLGIFKNLRVNKPIVINGIIKAKEKGKLKSVEHILYMHAHSIELEDESERNKFNENEVEKFQQMAADPEIKDKLVASYCPEVVGMNNIKEALILQTLRGNNVYDDKNNLLQRGTFSICVVGDVGTAKTKLAKLSLRYAPPGARMASGKGASAVGLVATVVHDKELGEWVLRAGAVALAHNSVCFIDELDKIEKDNLNNLNNTMSDLQTPIDKAGINTTIQTNTAIIGVANPRDKRFHNDEEIESQIVLPDDIRDRLDLIFIVRDEVEEETDRKVIGIVLDTYNEEKKETPYTQTEVKNYLTYMSHLKPMLSKEAKMFIENEYVTLRKVGKKEGITRFSARLGESIIRLATATAKLHGRKSVNLEDVESGQKMLIECMKKRGLYDDRSGFSIEKIEGITSQTNRDKYKSVKECILILAKKFDLIFENAIVEQCFERFMLEEDDVKEQIQKLKDSAIIYEPKRRQYQLCK